MNYRPELEDPDPDASLTSFIHHMPTHTERRLALTVSIILIFACGLMYAGITGGW